MKISKLFVLALIVFAAGPVLAQVDHLELAKVAFEESNYKDARDKYLKAYQVVKKPEDKAMCLFMVAETYRLTGESSQASDWYSKALKANYQDPVAQLYYADMLKLIGKYPEAIAEYTKYKEKKPEDSQRADAGIKSCELAQKWLDKAPTRYKVENFAIANTKYTDMCASYGKRDKGDYKNIIFTSGREEATGNNRDQSWTMEKFTDLFETTQDKKGSWSTPVPLSAPVSTDMKEGASTLDMKGTEMYFTVCGEVKTKTKGTVFACKLYYTKKKGASGWEEPKVLPFCDGDSMNQYTFGHPSLSPDESTLYFTSNMPGGQGGRDIWMTTYDKKKKVWSDPVNLGPAINTPGDEMYPYIRADSTLFFSSDGHPGMGGLDIFKTKKTGSKWATPENLKYPLNSPAHDYAIVWEDKTERGFLTSNREGGKGGDDIYLFYLPPLLFTLGGEVSEIDEGKAIPGAVVKLVVTNIVTKEVTTYEDTTDEKGTYYFGNKVIRENENYVISANKKDFLGAKGSETTVGREESTDLKVDLKLKTIKKPIELPNILYDLDKATLRPESMVALDGLVKTLNDNPNITIELGSHTDVRGSAPYNRKLAQARAQSVVDYLIQKGIDSARLVAKGYGEDVPRKVVGKEPYVVNYEGKDYSIAVGIELNEAYINKFKNDKAQFEAYHQANRRTEFRVLRTDYVPRNKPVAPIEGSAAPAPPGTDAPKN